MKRDPVWERILLASDNHLLLPVDKRAKWKQAQLVVNVVGKTIFIGAGLASAVGLCVLLRYCYTINITPPISPHDTPSSLIALMAAGLLTFLIVVLYPFTPGLLFRLAGGTARLTKNSGKLGICAICSVFVVAFHGAGWGIISAYYELHGSLGRLHWITKIPAVLIEMLFVVMIGVSVGLFVWSAIDVRKKSEANGETVVSRRHLAGSIFTIGFAELLLTVVMYGYGPILLRLSAVADPGYVSRIAMSLGPIVLVVIGILEIGNSQDKRSRTAVIAAVGIFGGFCLVLLSGELSGIAMQAFRLGNYGPVEVVVKKTDLAKFPISVRKDLKVQPIIDGDVDGKGPPTYYSVSGAYVLLRMGTDVRFGIPTDPSHPRSINNKINITTAWSIPNSDIVTIQELQTRRPQP